MKLSRPLIAGAIYLSIFGAGCSPSSTTSPVTKTDTRFRQPDLAAPPAADPVIPKEAEKIPRPY